MTDINEGLPTNGLRLFLRTINMATPEQVIRLGKESADHIDALPDTAAARWKSNAQSATGTLSVVRAMIGEMFGAIASIESEDATLLRGPEPKHTGEAILEALQRVQSALETARNDALREAARAVAPKGDEPSVDPSNHGDTAELAYWWEAKSNEEAILALIDKEPFGVQGRGDMRDRPISDNPSGMYCPTRWAVGLSHCSDPEHCGGMQPMAPTFPKEDATLAAAKRAKKETA